MSLFGLSLKSVDSTDFLFWFSERWAWNGLQVVRIAKGL